MYNKSLNEHEEEKKEKDRSADWPGKHEGVLQKYYTKTTSWKMDEEMGYPIANDAGMLTRGADRCHVPVPSLANQMNWGQGSIKLINAQWRKTLN